MLLLKSQLVSTLDAEDTHWVRRPSDHIIKPSRRRLDLNNLFDVNVHEMAAEEIPVPVSLLVD